MGHSKIPLFAFVDETGNTGHNLFDDTQPDFFTASLITKGDFDAVCGAQVSALAQRFQSNSLHAQNLGIGRLEILSEDFASILVRSQARFFVSRVEKKYLLCTKIFDAIFDSGENAAVAWHHYNLRPMRLILAFKLASTVDMDTAKLFWRSILEPKEEKAIAMLPSVCDGLLANLDRVPDARSREILGDGLRWAREHPETIQIHTDRKSTRQGHLPNLVAFANLLDGLEKISSESKRRVAKIRHDQQSEFGKTLAAWHEMFSTAAPDELKWAGETYRFQKVVGSEFEISEDSNSPGIQVADVVLWLYSQFRKGRQLPPGCMKVIGYVLSNGWENDFSFSGVEREAMNRFGPMLTTPLTEKQEVSARQALKELEKARLSSMEKYKLDHLPPFMRGKSLSLPDSGSAPEIGD